MAELTPMGEARLAICNACQYNVQNLCALCGCDVVEKVNKIEESCPDAPPRWHSGTGFTIAQQIAATSCKPCSERR